MKRHNQWVIWYATLIHMIWGVLLLISKAPFSTNPIGFFASFFSVKFTALLFLLGGLSALTSIRCKNERLEFLLLMPQQLLLLLTSVSGISSAFNQQYIDGVGRPGLFIFADQLPIILLGIMYCFGMYERFGIIGNYDNSNKT